MTSKQLFDDWAQRYEQWFKTPVGKLVKDFESGIIDDLLKPQTGEKILDAGCGTGIFTLAFLAAGAEVVGLEISDPMLRLTVQKSAGYPCRAVQGDMLFLPFKSHTFDKAVSITALEFIKNAQKAVDELFRVTKPGGTVVVATLNSLSPWAERRKAKTRHRQKHVLANAHYRSPSELLSCAPYAGVVKTAIHFDKYDSPVAAVTKENHGRLKGLDTGAFVAVCWKKP